MRITEIRHDVVSIASEIKNAYIDFSKMTVSIAAIVTDVIREGKPVVGYGFHSNGRYAQPGLLEQVDYKNFEMRIFPIGPQAEQKVQILLEKDGQPSLETFASPDETT